VKPITLLIKRVVKITQKVSKLHMLFLFDFFFVFIACLKSQD